ncbi:Gamma-aminobutyric acid type B receptor subunit 2 [Eumeta japonica]|uniref:Gamma-aminobutyric acid type B receptor subunit 2 n=1 Tax=Eumeta variegata TaxID=151549 RepID=A0A4C1T472_EUMVA|nr:Gamma-aminobutyric acid type B receptor subunit 2 [Eumeta japonica]
MPMINLGIWTPPTAHGLIPTDVYESGVSLDPGRFGWFVGPADYNATIEELHYSVFLNRSNEFYDQYVMDPDQLNALIKLNDLNQKRIKFGFISNEMYDELACNWLQNHTDAYKLWLPKEPMTLTIGAIFPIKKTQEVMKICETLEPIAGISRHTNMAVISYSAEGASFIDRHAYPFFFRTIGSNRQYEDVYTSLMKELGWTRVAALTEDGQKYAEYISHMETALKNNNLELIVNRKFLSDITNEEMNKMTAHHGYVWFLRHGFRKIGNLSRMEAFDGHFSIMHTRLEAVSLMQENITVSKWFESYNSTVSSVSKVHALRMMLCGRMPWQPINFG